MRTKHRTTAAEGLIVVTVALYLAWAPAGSASAKEPADADVTSAINTELWDDNAVSANAIDVTTSNGIVTLKGTVDSILAKERARALAEAIVGVRAIVNLVDVKPATPRDDQELAKAVETAWFADPATDTFELNASAMNGVVTLTGTVQSYAERDLSETVAKGVRGVKGIKNEIRVVYTAKRPDSEIEDEIKARLENDVRVDAHLVEVSAKDGAVQLSGAVGSLQEKLRAERDAQVLGVNSVDTDNLDVAWWERDKMRRKSAFVSRTDDAIRKAIKDAFRYDPRVFSFDPSVDVSSGTVTLKGNVDNLAAKRAAEQDAENTLGVLRVKDQLKVRPEIPGNAELEKRVAAALNDDPYVERYEISLDAAAGWVYLSGNVNTSFEKNQAERVTEGVKGVAGVVNNLAFKYRWTWKPDWEIREDVKDQLYWSPFVDSRAINVSVHDGVVSLSGTAGSWREREDAEENAYQGGAKDVENFVTVVYPYYGSYGPAHYGYPY